MKVLVNQKDKERQDEVNSIMKQSKNPSRRLMDYNKPKSTLALGILASIM